MTRQNATSYMGKAMRSVSVLAIIYILLVLFLPADHRAMHAYNLTPAGYHALLFSVALPALLVWYAGFYAYAKLYEYAECIDDAAESTNFALIARGVKWLAWSLPVWLIVTLTVTAMSNKWGCLFPIGWAISNYTQLLLPLIGFSVIGAAARRLIRQSNINFSLMDAQAMMLSFIIGGVLYCYLIFRHFGSSVSLVSAHNIYLLPVWLVIVTIMVPYLYTWFVGLLAAREISVYSSKLSGVLYKQPFRLFVAGLILVIISVITFQYASSLEFSSRYLKLDGSLVALQFFNLLRGIGFILIAIGAARLKKIEEV